MKLLFISLKDIVNYLRSPLVIIFMFLLPLLQAGLPYMAFHGFSGEFEVQSTNVLILNLDQAVSDYPEFIAGDLLIDMFTGDGLDEILTTKMANNLSQAETAMEHQEADILIIIPENFTASLFQKDRIANIVVKHDPTLQLGPSIVRDIITSFTDGFTGSIMAADVAENMNNNPDPNMRLSIMRQYGNWAQSIGESLAAGIHPGIDYQDMDNHTQSESIMDAMIGPLLVGMMVFFCFFVGAISAQSILREEEQGTLQRLFTTPTRLASVLIGKFLAIVILLGLQSCILILIGNLLFKIYWGNPIIVFANILGLIFSAAGFGILLCSFLRSSQQSFLVLGGAVILSSLAGGTMTTTFDNLPALFSMINFFTPQGWIINSFLTGMNLDFPIAAFQYALTALSIGLLCLLIAFFKFKKKFS